MTGFGDQDRDLLLRLLALPTAGPLETGPRGPRPQLWAAQRQYARAAAELGFRTVYHGCATRSDLAGDDVPLVVREAIGLPDFLATQPSLVLRLGPRLPREATVMFNVHLDTVAGIEAVEFNGSRFTGRGAIDAKGQAVALLAGVRAALARTPRLGRVAGVVIQAVSGEEGGAMGTIGTRRLIKAGHYGRLNVFCEPTGLRYLTRATAAMTARVRVAGQDAIDDRPGAGHNATVLLGFLAQHFARVSGRDGTLCVAGLRTGELHNRVYGTGQLLMNLAYQSSSAGRRLERVVTEAFYDGLAEFAATFAGTPEFGRTAAEAAEVTTLDWAKRGLPCLDGRDDELEALLAGAGLARWPADEPAFTCDAIWMSGLPGAFTVVLGAGTLDGNHAHAAGEYADLADLQAFADAVTSILTGFATRTPWEATP
jgi:acetylornithine deacetylase/succinyl-diaminopimelate desuccinylase-like protein